MAEALHLNPTEDGTPARRKPSSGRSRKSGCSNIFSGVNLHQLHRLFQMAGDRNAGHRAKLLWKEMETDVEREEKNRQEEDEAGLAQALVGLRVRARNKAGLRSKRLGDHEALRASGCIRVEEPLAAASVEEDDADLTQSREEFELPTTEDGVPEIQSSFRSAPWRLCARLESARDSERYLHRILH